MVSNEQLLKEIEYLKTKCEVMGEALIENRMIAIDTKKLLIQLVDNQVNITLSNKQGEKPKEKIKGSLNLTLIGQEKIETEKAYQISTEHGDVWVPKKAIKENIIMANGDHKWIIHGWFIDLKKTAGEWKWLE